MNLLIVEDDRNKLEQIIALIQSKFPTVNIEPRRSYKSGLRSALTSKHDLILLDMTMPTFDISIAQSGGSPFSFAGREILRQMKRKQIPTRVVVVTQFDIFGDGEDQLSLEELTTELKEDYPNNFIGSVYYSSRLEQWKHELAKFVDAAVNKEPQ